jgi:DNA-binding transcriptional MerR regulator/mannose-6-phosphate isomerase-like protein (cupin superfamily)
MAGVADGAHPAASAPLGSVGIEEAARLVGASPSALREWERQGLVRPARTTGGARRYLADDLDRLQRIRSWRTVDGLNAAAIRRLLSGPDANAMPPAGGRHRAMIHREDRAETGVPSEPMSAMPTEAVAAGGAATTEPWPAGSQLRVIRRSQALTLREAAARSGLSASFISSLERGVTGASIATLRRLLDAYGTTIRELLAGDSPTDRRLVRPGERRVFDAGRGIRIEDLFAGRTTLESQLFVLAPGASSDGYYRHIGEEFMFVLTGSLGVWLDGPHEFYRLEAGDALTFPSTVDHRIAALGQAETRVLWINTPPTF